MNEESNISHPQQDNRDLEQMFPKINQDQIGEIKRNLEKKNLNQDEKIKKLFDEFKIKWFRSYSFNPSGDRKNHKCPYFRCSKQFSKPQSLRNHMKKSHPKLSDIDLTIDDYGVFTWSEKALDYCILLGNIFPQFNKSIIKEMKQRKEVA